MTLTDPVSTLAGVRSVALHVAIIDDHPLYREALERVLATEDHIVLDVSARSIEEYAARSRTSPDVVVVDLRLPGLSGGEGVRYLVSQGLVVLVLSSSFDGPDVVEAISAGARGFVSKDAHAHEIVAALRTVSAGRSYVSPTLAGYLLQNLRPTTGPEVRDLSDREREVLSLVARGDTDHEVGQRLGISVSTVRSHLDRIRDKTGQRRRADLTRFALRHSILAE